MFNKRRKQALKEAQILIALALNAFDQEQIPEAKIYVDQALERLCSQNKEVIRDTVAFVNNCLNGEQVEEILGYDLISLAKIIGKLKIEKAEDTKEGEEMEEFFYDKGD